MKANAWTIRREWSVLAGIQIRTRSLGLGTAFGHYPLSDRDFRIGELSQSPEWDGSTLILAHRVKIIVKTKRWRRMTSQDSVNNDSKYPL